MSKQKDPVISFDPSCSRQDFAEFLKVASKDEKFSDVSRVYIGGTYDGLGDIMHLISRSSANMALPEEFRAEFPEIYLIEITLSGFKYQPPEKELDEAQEEEERKRQEDEYIQNKKLIIKETLSNLPEEHPMHIFRIAKSVFFLDEEPLPDIKDGAKIVYSVSVKFAEKLPTKQIFSLFNAEELMINNLEFSLFERPPDGPIRSLENRNMGFSVLGHGVFVSNESMTDEQILKAFNESSGEERILLNRILGLPEDHQTITERNLDDFRKSSILLLAYSDKDNDLIAKIKSSVIGSQIASGKKVVILGNGQGEEGSGYKIINKGNVFLSDDVYSAAKSLVGDLHISSGDNTFQEAINLGKLPFGPNYKKYHFLDFVNLISQIDDERLGKDDKGRLIKYFGVFDETRKEMLTPELITSWQKLCDVIKQDHNYFDIVNKMELQSCVTYYFIKSDNPDVKFLDLFTDEEKVCLLCKMQTECTDPNKVSNLLAKVDREQLMKIDNALDVVNGKVESYKGYVVTNSNFDKSNDISSLKELKTKLDKALGATITPIDASRLSSGLSSQQNLS